MNVASSQLIIAGRIREVFEEHRAAIEEELRKLPLISFSARCGESVLIDVEYDGDNPQLEEDLITLISDALETAVPAEVRERFQSPSFSDETLGTFYWDEDLRRWQGEFDFTGDGEPKPVNLDADRPEDSVADLVRRVREIAARFAVSHDHWKDIAVRDLFEIFNDNWNSGETLTAEAFRDELKFEALTIRTGGAVSANFFAGDLFCEHDVDVVVHANGDAEAHISG